MPSESAQVDLDAGTITHSVWTAAPRKAVWVALTGPEHVEAWWKHPMTFPDGIRPGSVGEFGLQDGGSFTVRIDRVDEPSAYALTWGFGDDLDESRATTVLFELAEEGEGTRITVTERGFDRLADLGERRASMEGNQEGWTLVLQWLPEYAEALR